jgi:hypothetical protein
MNERLLAAHSLEFPGGGCQGKHESAFLEYPLRLVKTNLPESLKSKTTLTDAGFCFRLARSAKVFLTKTVARDQSPASERSQP